jgi:hypothetical protein
MAVSDAAERVGRRVASGGLLWLEAEIVGSVALAGDLACLRVAGEGALVAVVLDLGGELGALLLVRVAPVGRDACGVGAERPVAVDVEAVGEAVAFDLGCEAFPLLGEADAGGGSVADQLAYVLGRVKRGGRGVAFDLNLPALVKFVAGRESVDERLAVGVDPLVGVPAGRVEPVELELDPFHV